MEREIILGGKKIKAKQVLPIIDHDTEYNPITHDLYLKEYKIGENLKNPDMREAVLTEFWSILNNSFQNWADRDIRGYNTYYNNDLFTKGTRLTDGSVIKPSYMFILLYEVTIYLLLELEKKVVPHAAVIPGWQQLSAESKKEILCHFIAKGKQAYDAVYNDPILHITPIINSRWSKWYSRLIYCKTH